LTPDNITASEWKRLRDWFADPQRKPANTAFTAGAARDAATAFESARCPNAPWLSEAHMLCTDMGIPAGNISDRMRALQEQFDIRRIPGHDQPQGVHVPTHEMLLPAIEAASREMVLEIARFIHYHEERKGISASAMHPSCLAESVRKEYL
jgi:hypothetical protein